MKKCLSALGLALTLQVFTGCGSSQSEFVSLTDTPATTDQILRQSLSQQGVAPITAPTVNQAKLTLGRNLFFDKLLSGNRDISCATCHHPFTHTGDGLSLPIGVGGVGFGPARQLGINQQTLQANPFVPRNAPEVFDRGQSEWTTMFWDMRVSGDPVNGFQTPAGANLPATVTDVLAAQAMFPVTSTDEMLGRPGDLDVKGNTNEISPHTGDFPAIWSALMARLLAIQAYQDQFAAAYPGVSQANLNFGHAADAIAEFERDVWTSTDAPFDKYLAGDDEALTAQQKRGALLFYGKAQCSQCHAGKLMTDQFAHNIGAPQLGPGKAPAIPLDHGRGGQTGDAAENFKFRTPPLRNVALTGPYFHNGAYFSLEAAVRHHLNARQSLQNYDANQLVSALRASVKNDTVTINQVLANLDPLMDSAPSLSDAEISDMLAFLQSLTSPKFVDQTQEVPASVPSGLPVSD